MTNARTKDLIGFSMIGIRTSRLRHSISKFSRIANGMQGAREKLKSSGTSSGLRIINSMRYTVFLIKRQAILYARLHREKQDSDRKMFRHSTSEKSQGLIGHASIKNLIKLRYSALAQAVII
jgi:hypothetical protein